jgi:hypothetical protein
MTNAGDIMASDPKHDAKQDKAVKESFPASDPPASMAASKPRAVPVEELMPSGAAEIADAVALCRRFDDMESAKLAVEAVVRDGPADRAATELREVSGGVELHIAVPAANADRLRKLLNAA